ncbi:MAG: cytochrome P450 [Erythrobacter sp.]
MFSQFATATREDGSLLPVDEVVDHMNFLMMAAHDTITSSATSLIYHLALNPAWQEKLREEIFCCHRRAGRAGQSPPARL